MSMSDDITIDPSGDDYIIRPRCRWCWLVSALLVAAIAALLLALWYAATKPQVNAYPVWCTNNALVALDDDDGFEPAIPAASLLQPRAPSNLADLFVSPARAQQVPPPGLNTPLDVFMKGRAEQHARWRIAQADGSRVAYEMLDDDPISDLILPTDEARRYASVRFEEISQGNGAAGFYRLALAYLGTMAFDIAMADKEDRAVKGHDRLVIPFCPDSEFVQTQNSDKAFQYLVWANDCDTVHPPLFQRWMDAIARESRWSARKVFQLQAAARKDMEKAIKVKNPQTNDPEEKRKLFCTGLIKIGEVSPPPPGECRDARNARQALKLGDAAQALGDIPKARACWRDAIRLAQIDPEGAPAAVTAQQRLQANSSTCKWTTQSVATISRDYRARSGDLIHMKVIQQALKALGHYDGPIDGVLSPVTRAAIRKFQRSVGTDETDTLTPLEITQLICNSAETTRDLVSVTTLGVMYAVGLGVQQDVDQAQQWLAQASTRRYADATYSLSILYGTGIILNSYRLCDAPRMPEQADRYLNEAADQGHPIAQALLQLYGPKSKYANLSPRERWTLIEMQQLENSTADRTGIYATKLAIVGSKCAPDRSIR